MGGYYGEGSTQFALLPHYYWQWITSTFYI
jgi:hypothetical protein